MGVMFINWQLIRGSLCTLESWVRTPVIVITSDGGALKVSDVGSLHSDVMFSV